MRRLPQLGRRERPILVDKVTDGEGAAGVLLSIPASDRSTDSPPPRRRSHSRNLAVYREGLLMTEARLMEEGTKSDSDNRGIRKRRETSSQS